MKPIIKHLVHENFDGIVKASLVNCHVRGLYSIMLLNSPAQTIRMFVADTNHDLYSNNKISFENNNRLSVGFHPHHCNLTLYAIKGGFLNWCVEEVPEENEGWADFYINKFKYHSAIREGKTNFELIGKVAIRTTSDNFIAEGKSVYMAASKLHTVSLQRNTVRAWLVLEGKEDANYQSVCYSNVDLDKEIFTDLYQPAKESDVVYALGLAGITI